MKLKNLKSFILLLLMACLVSCKNEYKLPPEIANIQTDVTVHRFDQRFRNLNVEELKQLQQEFPYLFSKEVTNEFWISKSKDTLQLELAQEIQKVFPVNTELEQALELFYKYLKFYYPQIEFPTVVGLVGEVDYRNRVVLTKELLLLSLDNYLGNDHYFYQDIQKYIRDDFEKQHLLVNIGQEYAKKIVARASDRDFLAQMILFGKRIYLLHKLLPTYAENQIIEYTEKEWEWAQENEAFIWRYFIEKDMLYSTEKGLQPRFLYPAPFSKFYLELDSQSSDRIGQYIGFKIVLAFMKRNDVSLQQMLEMDSKSLFEASNYKPKK